MKDETECTKCIYQTSVKRRVNADVIGGDVCTPKAHMFKAREQLEVREKIMYDRGLDRSKPSLDRDEPFPVQGRLFIWQMAAMSFLETAAPHIPAHILA